MMQLLIVIGIWDIVWPYNQSKIMNYIRAILYGIPLYFTFWFFIKEKEILRMEYSKKEIKFGNILLIAYIIFDIALMVMCINFIK